MVSSRCKIGLEINIWSLEETSHAKRPETKTKIARIPAYRLALMFHWRMSDCKNNVPRRSPFSVTSPKTSR